MRRSRSSLGLTYALLAVAACALGVVWDLLVEGVRLRGALVVAACAVVITAGLVAWFEVRRQRQAVEDARQDSAPGRPDALPPPAGALLGRDERFRQSLDDLSPREGLAIRGRRRGSQNPRRARIAVVHGAPGTGKTHLALHVAHRLKQDFPGGCLL